MYTGYIEDPQQIEYVEKGLKGHNILLGTAGSGKTNIGLAVLRKLAYEPGNGNILFVSFTNALIKACSKASVLNAVKEADSAPEQRVKFTTVHNLFSELIKDAKGNWPFIIDSMSRQELIALALDKAKAEWGSLPPHLDSPEVLQDEINFLEDWGIAGLGEYLKCKRIGRRIENIDPEMREFFWLAYQKYLKLLKADKYDCDYQNEAQLVQQILREQPDKYRWRNIIIDEGQDFSPVVIRTVVQMLEPGGTLLYLGDTAQEIYGTKMSWKNLGLEVQDITRLGTCYRNTVEIGAFAIDILRSEYWDKSTEEVIYPGNMTRHGIKPALTGFASQEEEYDFALQFLQQFPEETTCFVLYRNRDVDELRSFLKDKGVTVRNTQEEAEEGDTCFVSTFHSVKGLEFDNVIILDFDEHFTDIVERLEKESERLRVGNEMKLFYVAATRARKRLVITHTGEVSKLFPTAGGNFTAVSPDEIMEYVSSEVPAAARSEDVVTLMIEQILLKKDGLISYFRRALTEAEEELDIQSPWMTERVVNDIFLDRIARLLRKNVVVKIAYGITDHKIVMKKNNTTDRVVKKLQKEFGGNKNFRLKKINSHAKKFVCDAEYGVYGSFNWLSYTGESDREEEGVVIKDKLLLKAIRKQDFDF